MNAVFVLRPKLILIPIFLFSLLGFAPLFGQSAPTHPEVKAMDGDGIYTLLRRHGLDPSTYLNSFLELNQGNMGANNSLLKGKSYRLPQHDPALSDTLSTDEASANTGKETQTKQLQASAANTQSNTKEGNKKSTEEVNKVKETTEKSAEIKEAKILKEKEAKEEGKTAAPAVLEVPLFGKKYARVEIKDQQLKGAVYYLVSGHGGPDPGAIGKYGPYMLSEDEYAYDVTIRLARRLMEHGATVYMIIQDPDDGIRDENILVSDSDERCYPDLAIPRSQKERLRQRTAAVNALYIKHKGAYQRMLSIHVDSRSKSQHIDVFFYHHENSPKGKQLAENIHRTFTSKYARYQPTRDYSGSVSTRSSLYVVKYSHPPSVFVELGNITNERDQRRFVIPDNRQALSNWIAEGILADYRQK